MSGSEGMRKKVLITGADGSLGQELARVFWDAGYAVVAANREKVDITDRDSVSVCVRDVRPALIVNAAAYNGVDKAEEPSEYAIATAVNADGPRFLAESARDAGIPFVHFSTDYVFGGDKLGGYQENDRPDPINAYGRTKAAGEKAVMETRGRWYVCRVSRIFGRIGVSKSSKMTFMQMMRKLAAEKPELKVVDEEYGMPTSARDIAQATLRLVEEEYPGGVYHLVNEGQPVTWFQFAEEIFAIEPTPTPRIPVSSAAFGPRAARRPCRVALLNRVGPMLRPRAEALRAFLSQPKVSVVIVTLNIRETVKENLRQMFAETCAHPFEVIVVDNGSSDGTAAMLRAEFPQVRLIQNAFNSGFAHACNQGLRISEGEVIVFYNPDMRPGKGALAHTYETLMARREIGAMGVRLVAEDGTTVESVRRDPGFLDQLAILLKLPHLFPSLMNRYLAKDFDYSRSSAVDQVRGSFFALRRDALNAVGPWDEKNFFVWFEEIDMCRRLREAGYVIWYDSDASCVDLVGRTFKTQSMTIKQVRFSRSMVRYFRKWHPAWQALLLSAVRPFAIAMSFLFERFGYSGKKQVT